jgi:hypothetical protein
MPPMNPRLLRPTKRKPSRPGAPTITLAIDGNSATWTAPASDGGSIITAYKFYVDGLWDGYDSSATESTEPVFAGQVVEVSAVNAVGEGPKSVAVVVTA